MQAVALAHVVDRSLLHHAPLGTVVPAIVVVGLAVLARAALHGAGDLSAHGAADRVVATLRGQLLRQALALGPAWLAGERPGELSLTATRGLRSLHTYFSRYLPQAAAAAVIPAVLLVWVATQDWLSFVVVIGLVIAVPLTMIYFGREATQEVGAPVAPAGLAGRAVPPARSTDSPPCGPSSARSRDAARWPRPPRACGQPRCARCGSPSSRLSPWT